MFTSFWSKKCPSKKCPSEKCLSKKRPGAPWCDSLLIKLLINFWTVGSIGMKLSGVARLVPSNYWVGSTLAQSLQGRPWPAPRPFAWNIWAPWFFMLQGWVVLHHFGKDSMRQTECWERNFDLGPRCEVAEVKGGWRRG